ncbi:salicylate hydroxylase [Rhypophila decipiens]
MPLDIIIVGAGIAGLSAAISLRRAGHRVRILERSALGNEVGAAINVCPNASRALLAWGLDPVANRFVEVQGILTAVGATLEPIVSSPLGPWVRGVYGAPLYFAHRVDLHEALKVLAVGEGAGEPAVLQLDTTVVGYDPETPAVTLSTGHVLAADLVIAADGIHSIAVEAALGHTNPPQPQDLYNGCFRFLIPAADLDSDPETRWWNKDGERNGKMSIYMNGKTGNRCVSYPCRNHELWNFVCMFHDDELAVATKEDWHAPVDKSHLLKAFPDFHPSLRAVLSKATDVKRWPLLYRAPIPRWTKEKLVIIGDAAHPMLPHQGQGGAQGIEDGIAMGIALSGVSSPSDIPQRLDIFEKARRDRASAIQILSNAGQEQVDIIHKEVEKYVGFVPKTPQEFSHFNWGHDIVRSTELLLRKEVDPEFKLPEGFFQGNFSPYMPSPPAQ